MWRKTKALPADPHCSYRCSTVGTLSLLRHSHTGNCAKKTPRIFGDFARHQIPKWQTKQFSDLWNWKNSTFPECFVSHWKKWCLKVLTMLVIIMPCSTASYWKTENRHCLHTLVSSQTCLVLCIFPLKEVKEYSCDSFNSCMSIFQNFSYFPQKNNKVWVDTRVSKNYAIVIWVNYPFNATWKNCKTSDNPVVLALFWAMAHSSSLYALQIVS